MVLANSNYRPCPPIPPPSPHCPLSWHTPSKTEALCTTRKLLPTNLRGDGGVNGPRNWNQSAFSSQPPALSISFATFVYFWQRHYHKTIRKHPYLPKLWPISWRITRINVTLVQGCIIRSILPSGMGARGVSSEHMENMEVFSCSPTVKDSFFSLQTLLFTAFLVTVLKILTYALVSTWSSVSPWWEHIKRKMHPCS